MHAHESLVSVSDTACQQTPSNKVASGPASEDSITPTGATLCAAIEHTIAPSIDSPTERQLAQLLHILADLMASCTSALRIDDNFPNAAA